MGKHVPVTTNQLSSLVNIGEKLILLGEFFRFCCDFYPRYIYIYTTIWLFNIAMENGPFLDDFPIKTSMYKGFSMAMLNNQMVTIYTILYIPNFFYIFQPPIVGFDANQHQPQESEEYQGSFE